MIGTRLGYYEITGHLGSGGMGDVYQATDSRLGRTVAIKILPEAFVRDQDRITRFEREARLLASLKELYFIGQDFKMMAVGIKISGSSLESTRPIPLFQTRVSLVPKHQYSVSSDGRFLVSELEETATPISLILNWRAK